MDKLSIIQRTLIVLLGATVPLYDNKCHSERILEIEIIPHLAVFALLSLNLRHLTQLWIDSTLVDLEQ